MLPLDTISLERLSFYGPEPIQNPSRNGFFRVT